MRHVTGKLQQLSKFPAQLSLLSPVFSMHVNFKDLD